MEKNKQQSSHDINEQDEIMNRVNQTFEKLTQDVKNLVRNNPDEND